MTGPHYLYSDAVLFYACKDYTTDVSLLFQWEIGLTIMMPNNKTHLFPLSSTLLFIAASRLRSALPRFKKTKSEYCAQGCHVPAVSGGSNVIWREKLLLAILSKVCCEISTYVNEQLVFTIRKAEDKAFFIKVTY